MAEKKNILTYAGLRELEEELQQLKVVTRKEVAQKIKEAREQGDLSENAEYDAAKDEQRDIEARIEEIEKILRNAEVVDEDEGHERLVVAFDDGRHHEGGFPAMRHGRGGGAHRCRAGGGDLLPSFVQGAERLPHGALLQGTRLPDFGLHV